MLKLLALIGLGIMTQSSLAQEAKDELGTHTNPIIDSSMSELEAFEGIDPKCPREVRERQRLIEVRYFGFDRKVHKGQLVLDADVVQDVTQIFEIALKIEFPIHSVIPVSHPKFRKDNRWDDDLSMNANNSSAFNFRMKTGGSTPSNHAFGRAIDINPMQNPYIKGDLILPEGAVYKPKSTGTLEADHPIVKAFIDRGWEWGGDWTSLKDYQHFEKREK
jgi:peptidoglycan L-alanyl-D-glutamate endopeptidase CwlK